MGVRPSSVAPDPAGSRGAPPPPQDPSPLRGTLGSSLRSPAEGEGQCMKVKSEREVAQSYLTPSDPMDYSLPGSSVHGIFQARGEGATEDEMVG